MSCIRVFFEFNHIFLERTFWKSTKRRGRGKNSKAISDEKNLSHDIIRQVLAHAKLNLKTIILVNSSSGMRIGETLQLTLDHIDFDSSPTKITLDAHMTKNREKRITFISDEATRHLKEWLKVRDDYLKTACARTHIKSYHDVLITKSADDDRVFPMSDETVRKMWNRVLRILELDETDRNTNIHKYKVHGLRKFFRNNFVKGGNGSITDACEQLMGHSGYLDGTYEHQSEEQLKEAYLQAVNHLLIIDQPMATPEAEDKIKKLEKELQHMKVLAEEQVRNYQAPQPAEIERQLIEEQHKNDELQKVLKANQEQYDKLWSVVQNLQQQMSSQ